jgi:hypothetical protein
MENKEKTLIEIDTMMKKLAKQRKFGEDSGLKEVQYASLVASWLLSDIYQMVNNGVATESQATRIQMLKGVYLN